MTISAMILIALMIIMISLLIVNVSAQGMTADRLSEVEDMQREIYNRIGDMEQYLDYQIRHMKEGDNEREDA